MSVLVTSDLHWNDSPRDSYRHHWLGWFAETAKREQADAIFILGDITDAKDGHRAWLVNAVVNHIHQLAEICPVIIVQGNHDFINPSEPFFQFLNLIAGVTWVNKPTVRTNDSKISQILLLPHTDDYKRDWKGLKPEKHKFVLTHNTFTGANFGHGPLAKGIPPIVFSDDSTVISGDIHIPQKVGPVLYCGAPYTIDFGDMYEPHVLLVGKNGVEKAIPCPGPRKRLVELESPERVTRWVKTEQNWPRGDMLKFRVGLLAEEHAQWPEVQDLLRKWGETHGYVVHSVLPQMISRSGSAQAATRRTPNKQDDSALVHQYVKIKESDIPTEKTGLRLLTK